MPRLSQLPLVVILALLACGSAHADASRPFVTTPDGVVIDAPTLRALPTGVETILAGFTAGSDVPVDLAVTRFRVTRPDTAFVVRRGGADVTLPVDRDALVHLDGRVRGEPDSRVLLTLGTRRSFAIVERNGRRTVLASRAGGAPNVLHAGSPGATPSGPPCAIAPREHAPGAENSSVGPIDLRPDVRVIELAVETDHEYFLLHDDASAAVEYAVQLYAGVSVIFRRDANARFALTFLRIWEDANDLFNETSPLAPFRGYWNDQMQMVPRDVAQFLSGRRNMPYGGAAYLGSLCENDGYSVVGYVLGSRPVLDAPSVFHYDTTVTAHELGHNCDARHTHDYGVDTCDDFKGSPQRGTIMSYCSQTVSGGNANIDLRFHAVVRDVMTTYFEGAPCLDVDCNENGIGDDDDIAVGTSLDQNANGRPDECEDCNGNGTFDKADTLSGTSPDVNGNLVPDECEPDCNGNGLPDAFEVTSGAATDANGDLVPDDCAPDDDNDGTADHVQIQADMALDLDRDLQLDATEDCDGDGTIDSDARDGAHDAWIAGTGGVFRFHAVAGTRVDASPAGFVLDPADLLITPDRRVLVSSAGDDRIVEFDTDGAYVGDLVPAGAGGLDRPGAMTIAPDGALLVTSTNTNAVLAYDLATGATLPPRVAPTAGGLRKPFGLAYGPSGNLFVSSEQPTGVLEFDGASGAYVRAFVSSPGLGGLSATRGLAFLPNGDLLAASYGSNAILRYDATDGTFLGHWNQGGTATALTLDQPWCIRVQPDGCTYVSRNGTEAESELPFLPDPRLHLNSSRIYCFETATGNFLRSYVLGNDTGLDLPTGFDFLPGDAIDCNRNGVPDACDIAQGTSFDVNGDGRPDECGVACPADLDGDASVGFSDLNLMLSDWGPCPVSCDGDLDDDANVGFGDLSALLDAWGSCA